MERSGIWKTESKLRFSENYMKLYEDDLFKNVLTPKTSSAQKAKE